MTTPLTSARGPRHAVLALLAAPLLVLAACGGDDESSGDTTTTPPTAVSTTVADAATSAAGTVGTSAATSDTADLPVGTGDLPPVGTGDLPPVDTADLPLPPVTADAPYPVSVTVGIDDNPDRIERVPLGATVTLTMTNPSADDEFHLHGFDLGDGQVVPAGQSSSFTFVANQVGSFELESHETGQVLLVLEVV